MKNFSAMLEEMERTRSSGKNDGSIIFENLGFQFIVFTLSSLSLSIYIYIIYIRVCIYVSLLFTLGSILNACVGLCKPILNLKKKKREKKKQNARVHEKQVDKERMRERSGNWWGKTEKKEEARENKSGMETNLTLVVGRRCFDDRH